MEIMKRKRALITGSSRGIGKAIALALAKEGYDCVINCREKEEEAAAVVSQIRDMGRLAFYIKADVRNYDDVSMMFSEIERQFGSIEVLVNNAGVAVSTLIQDCSFEEWKRVMDTNVDGMFSCTQHALKHMLDKKEGVIINMASVWGMVGAAMEIPYSASKGAVIAFTKALAKEVGFSGIRVNCVAPGGVDTDMLSPLSKDIIDEVIGITPAGRLGKPEEIADLVAFLVSEKGEFFQGQVISPNGGLII